MRPPKTLCIAALLLCTAIWAGAQIRTDWSVPYPRPLGEPADTVEVFIIGDVMMHTRQLNYDCSTFLENITPAIRRADIAVANMEFPLGGRPYTGYPAFSTPDYYAEYVKDCGVDVFLTANNHVLDRGSRGLGRTLCVYDSLGVKYTGTAADAAADTTLNPLIVSRKGISIALVDFTYGTNAGSSSQWPLVNRQDKERISAQIRRARERGADFVVALPHWGVEYDLHHSATQESWARWLVSEGVDAIVGAHPHVVQDTTHIGGVPVIYSMGNAVSNMSATNTRCELAVTLRFVIDHTSGTRSMLEPQLQFMWCTLPGNLTGSYATIFIKEWATRRTEWLIPSDFDNMVATWRRVKSATHIED